MATAKKKKAPARAAAKKGRPRAAAVAERILLSVEQGAAPRPLTTLVKRRTEKMLDVLGLTSVEVSLALVGDETIADLNGRFRKKPKPTDVLSFPLHSLPIADLMTAAASSSLLLGDVVVSIPTAERQANERKRSLADEVTTLIAHGILHLLGYDHRTDDEEREMDAFVKVLEAAATNKKPLALRLSAG